MEDMSEHFHTVMGAVTLLYDPLAVHALSSLLQTEAREIRMALLCLHSLVIVPDEDHKLCAFIHIASGSNDETERIRDAKTGVHLATLMGHSDWVRSVAFSPDGIRIASGSDNKTVRIWEAKTGVHLATQGPFRLGDISRILSRWQSHCLQHPQGPFKLRPFSRIASGSNDETV